jgi:hypothetical protein
VKVGVRLVVESPSAILEALDVFSGGIEVDVVKGSPSVLAKLQQKTQAEGLL